MENPTIASREEWLAARKDLLGAEKEATRLLESLAARRRALPMVRVDKEYLFSGPAGTVGLADLFEGRHQLIVYHFMWLSGPDEGCPSCSFTVDNMPDPVHLHADDTSLVLVSRAHLPSIERFRTRMGWSLPWYSSMGSDFNYDFHVSNDPAAAPVEYNYMDEATLRRKGMDNYVHGDGQGFSVFLRDGSEIFHTYSTYGRGADVALTTFHLQDLTPLGRRRHVGQIPYHDRYAEGALAVHAHH